MSVLNVENVSHGFGARTILEDASFRLLKGEHVGLIGANGEGKSTFLNIITGQLQQTKVKLLGLTVLLLATSINMPFYKKVLQFVMFYEQHLMKCIN